MKHLMLLASVSSVGLLIATQASAAPIDNYAPVTQERLKNPEPGNWLQIRRTYDGQMHSPLTQITPENVKGLKQVWTATTGPRQKVTEFAALPADTANQAPPMVNNGVMIVSAGDNQIIALDAKDGQGDLALRLHAAGRAGAGAPDQPRRGAVGRQDLLLHARRPSRRARRQDRQGTLEVHDRELGGGLLHHRRPPGRERQGDDRHLRRRVRHPRLRCRL